MEDQMKKRILLVASLLLLTLLAFTGCNFFKKPGENKPSGNLPGSDSIIFGGDFKIVVPEKFPEAYGNYIFELDNILAEITGKASSIVKDSEAAYKHEILLGETNRELSSKAYRRLDRMIDDKDETVGYVLYSDGSSIAIAFDSTESLELALEKLEGTYFSPSYGKAEVPSGVLHEWKYDIVQLYEERDAIIMNERWQALEKEITDSGYDGKATVAAFKQLYTLYTDKIYMWMADLYDPVLGGFYYSNSGRNTLGFLPDIESTMQILNFIRYSGMNNRPDEYPEEFKTAIVEFVKTKQSSLDGYFYHPQWEDLVITDERRGRDQMWALEILRMFRSQPLYDTGGVSGSLGAPGVSPTSYLASPLKRSTAFSVSKVIPTATLDHLSSQSAFKAYLDSQNWADAYVTGNRLAAQVTSIKSAGLLPYCIEYLNGKQRANGMFDDQEGDYAVNGFLKIAALYQNAQTVIPRSDKAAEFCLDVLSEDEPAGTVCWVYNVWYSLDIITSLLYDSGNSSNIELADTIRGSLRKNAPKYLSISLQKYGTFLKPDGSFSFTPDKTSDLSQGMPVAVSGTNEGDVNGTYISSIGLMGYIFGALDYERVEPYTENDYKLFIKRIGELDAVIKNGTSAGGGINFAGLNNLNDAFHAISNTVLDIRPEEFDEDTDPNWAYCILDEDLSTEESSERGQFIEYAKPNFGFETRVEIANRSVNKSRFIYEFDLKFMGGNVENGSWHTRFALYGNGKRFYSILAYTLEDGSLALGSRNEPIAVIPCDEWHTLRFEYYTDTPDRACKIFVDGVYAGEGGTSDPSNGDSTLSRAFIEYRKEATDVLYCFDNIVVSSDDEAYVPPTVEVGDASGSHYSDASVKGKRYDYDNAEELLPSLLNGLGGTLSVVDGRLHYTLKNASGGNAMLFELPVSAAEAKYENFCKIFELEFSYGTVSSDSPISFLLGNQEYTLVKDSENGKLNIKDKYNNDKIIKASLEANTVYVLRFECYSGADDDIYNITKVYINEEYAGELYSKYIGNISKFGIKLNDALVGTDGFVTVENLLLANVKCEYVRQAGESDGGMADNIGKNPSEGGNYYSGNVTGNRFDCDEIEDGMQTDGVTSGSDDTAIIIDGTLVYTRNNIKGESYMRWNHEKISSLETPVFIFETDFRFDGFMGNTPEQKIVFQAGGISHLISPAFEVLNGVQTMSIGKMVLNEGTWYNIRFELDYEAGKIYYFVNGGYVGYDYLAKTANTATRTLWYYMDKQTAGSMRFDNTFEGLVEVGTLCSSHTDSDKDGICDNCPMIMDPDDGGGSDDGGSDTEIGNVPPVESSGGIFYNGSASGNRFNCNTTDGIQIDGVTENDAVGNKNGVFVFTRNNSTGKGESYIRWNHEKPEGFGTPVFIFETDFVFTDYLTDSVASQKIVIEANGIKHIIVPSLSEDRQTMTVGKLTVKSGVWCNIRFEIDYASGMIHYFKNEIYQGFEYLSKDTTQANRVLWYYMAPQKGGSMGFDNIFEGFVEDGSFCETHIDENNDGKCDNCPLDMPPPPKPEIILPENTLGGGDFYTGTEVGNRFNCDEMISGDNGMKTDGVTQNDEAEFKNGVFIFTRYNDTGKGESYVRWNHLKSSAFTSPLFIFETDFIFKDFTANSASAQKIVIEANGIQHIIIPSLSDDRQTMTIGGENGIVLENGEWNNIRFELDYAAGMIYYFQNGEYKASDYLSKNTISNNRVLWYYMAAQTGGSMGFDNTYEALAETGTVCDTHIDENNDGKCDNCPLDMPPPPKPEVIIPENTSGGGDFYKGNETGNRFNCDSENGNLKTDGITANDEAVYENGVLVFNRYNDTGNGESYLRWNPPSQLSKVFIFETDFFFTGFPENAQTSLIRFLITSGVDYQLKPAVSSDGKTMTVGKLELSSDKWYNLRFEIEVSTGNVNYFLDGEFVGKGVLTSGGASYTGRVLWYYTGAQSCGTMAFDNTFVGYTEEGTVVCEEHTDANKDGKCDMCEETVELPPPVIPDPPVTPDPDDSEDEGTLGGEDYQGNTDGNGWLNI